MHNKLDKPKKVKTTYNLEQREYTFSNCDQGPNLEHHLAPGSRSPGLSLTLSHNVFLVIFNMNWRQFRRFQSRKFLTGSSKFPVMTLLNSTNMLSYLPRKNKQPAGVNLQVSARSWQLPDTGHFSELQYRLKSESHLKKRTCHKLSRKHKLSYLLMQTKQLTIANC